MTWRIEKGGIDPNQILMRCADSSSPVRFIILDTEDLTAIIAFRNIFGEEVFTPLANEAIKAIQRLKVPFAACEKLPFAECTNPPSTTHKKYLLTNFKENLPKIVKFLDPDNTYGLAAALVRTAIFDAAMTFATPIAPQPPRNLPTISEDLIEEPIEVFENFIKAKWPRVIMFNDVVKAYHYEITALPDELTKDAIEKKLQIFRRPPFHRSSRTIYDHNLQAEHPDEMDQAAKEEELDTGAKPNKLSKVEKDEKLDTGAKPAPRRSPRTMARSLLKSHQ